MLHEVVEAVRRKRLGMKSLEETARMTNFSDDFKDRPNWDVGVWTSYARFGFQGDRQFYGDATGIMRRPPWTECFRVGSDGRECWCFSAGRLGDSAARQRVAFRPYNAVRQKLVAICDPFGVRRFPSTRKAIEALKLEYLGAVTGGGQELPSNPLLGRFDVDGVRPHRLLRLADRCPVAPAGRLRQLLERGWPTVRFPLQSYR